MNKTLNLLFLTTMLLINTLVYAEFEYDNIIDIESLKFKDFDITNGVMKSKDEVSFSNSLLLNKGNNGVYLDFNIDFDFQSELINSIYISKKGNSSAELQSIFEQYINSYVNKSLLIIPSFYDLEKELQIQFQLIDTDFNEIIFWKIYNGSTMDGFGITFNGKIDKNEYFGLNSIMMSIFIDNKSLVYLGDFKPQNSFDYHENKAYMSENILFQLGDKLPVFSSIDTEYGVLELIQIDNADFIGFKRSFFINIPKSAPEYIIELKNMDYVKNGFWSVEDATNGSREHLSMTTDNILLLENEPSLFFPDSSKILKISYTGFHENVSMDTINKFLKYNIDILNPLFEIREIK